ncbi:MAG: flagellar hook-basal body complex protein FliE [Nitrospirae bacterium CG2_30_70_394]|nr:MAG: flagellar hook-basal body complex protein FliE [Nitrospirae bacterium CG2_30_70_394]
MTTGFRAEQPPTLKGASFADLLQESLGTVSVLDQQATVAATNLVTGQGGELHDVMIRMKESEVAFDLVLAVRNKAIEAYQDVMRMQV